MPSELGIAVRRLLEEFAELSLEVARDLQAAMKAAGGARDLVRLADAFAKVGRGLRMSIALASRLARGEALAPAPRDRGAPAKQPEGDHGDEEGPEGLERETLFDRLPAGDPATQIAAISHGLVSATRALPDAAAYRARCEALIARARRELPLRPPDEPRRPPPPVALAPNRSRGSPGA